MIIGVASADHLRADRSPDNIEKWGGAGWARIGQYVPWYRDFGHEVVTGVMWKRPDGLYIEDADHNYTRPDILLMQRLMVKGVGEAIEFGKSQGQIIVNDVDDWYWGLDPRNSAYQASHPKFSPRENTRFYQEVIRASSVITVSTAWLGTKMKEMTGGRVPIHHIPNYVDVNRFTPVMQSAGTPQLGWAGSTEHRSGDLETLRGIIAPLVESGRFRLHHSGAWLPEDNIEDGFAKQIGVPSHLITSTPRAMAEDYPSLLTFDVGLVPLRDTPFNHAKSYIKGLEYAASAIPFVAQALPEYKDLHALWGEGFVLAEKPKHWRRELEKFLDINYRLDMAAHALDNVKAHDVSYGAARWTGFLEGLL